MLLLDHTFIRDKVDYSFGDESGHRLPGGYMKPANRDNKEFLRTYQSLRGVKPYMTLFIDNIRLYKRKCRYTAVEAVRDDWRTAKDNKLADLADQDLLALCASHPDMDFLIFSGFEDTPIDEEIFNRIPPNVIAVHACNATTFGGKVIPVPYGLQRRLHPRDERHEILTEMINIGTPIHYALYLNFSETTNPERPLLNKHFSNKPWATVKQPMYGRPEFYRQYLMDIKQHQFVLCPPGNAIGCDCHREWEVLYMCRVPVVERSPYLEAVFEGFPVLFVDSFYDITEDMLRQNAYLLQQHMNWNLLDIQFIYKTIIDAADLSYQHSPENGPTTAEHAVIE